MSSADVKAEYAGLVKAAATGDRGAMEALLVRAQEVAYRFSLLVCGHPEDAEDVMQDALLKTYQHVATISEPEAFRTWLYSTVRNACLMKRRRRVGEPSNFVSVERGIETSDGRVHVDVDECANGVSWLARRICSGVRPVRRRRTFTKWDASENPARRPISAVVTRSNSGDCSMRAARSTRAWISIAPNVSPHAASARCRLRLDMWSELATSAACRDVSAQRCRM